MNKETINSIINYNERATKEIERLKTELDKYKNVIDKIKEYCIKEQARIVINNTEEDEFVYTELLQLIDKLLEEVNE